MITITCDMCGTRLNALVNRVEMNLESDTLVTLNHHNFNGCKKELCVACATRLINWIGNQLEKEVINNGK